VSQSYFRCCWPHAHNLERIVSHYTDDAQVTFPDWAFPAQGKDAIRPELKEFLAAGNLSVSFRASGRDHPFPIQWGTYSLTWKDPKVKTWAAEDGPYLTVFRELANGSWAVVEQKYYGLHLRYPIPDGNYLRPLSPDPANRHAIVG
jgi:ketosteroid isomerase-like protein